MNQEPARDLWCRGIELRPGTINEEERSVEAVLSTENPASVYDFARDEVIEEVLVARGAKFPTQLPLLDAHQRQSTANVLGSIRNIREEGAEVIGRLFFLRDDAAADRAWKLVKDGHQRDVSIGYKPESFQDIPAGKSRSIDGKTYTAGNRRKRITTSYRIREGSLVPIGADQAAKIRAEGLAPSLERSMKPETRKYLESLGLRADATEDQAVAFRDALGTEQVTRAAAIEEGKEVFPPVTPPAEPQRGLAPVAGQSGMPQGNANHGDAIRAERERIEAIRELAADSTDPELIKRAIKDEWTVDRTARAILQQERDSAPPAASPFAQHNRSREKDVNREVLAKGFRIRTGGRLFDADLSEQKRKDQEAIAEQAHRFRDMSLVDLARECCRIDKARIDGCEPQTRDEYIRAALSTPTLSYVFTDSVNSQLIGAYEEAGDTTDFCEVVDVTDFKPNTAMALGKTGQLTKLPRGKTADHATFDDSKETYRVQRYARQFSVDEQDMIDDSHNAFSSIAPGMGAASGRMRPDLVYSMILANPTLLADSLAVFHATHANTDTSALSSANLKTGVSKIRKQTQNGVNLNITPQYLVCATTLEWTARELLNSASLLIAGTAGSVTERSSKNLIADIGLQLRMDARLDNGVTDPDTGVASTPTTTAWYLFSKAFRTIRVAYRAGTGRRPSVRDYLFDKGQWGMGWDINLDIGCKFLDYRGCYRGNA